ncbi:NAD(P)-dependent oxidoreductase [Microbacterium sp. MAHUQ-60]|uniref:NAD(P)-dependent oxidoreductase n=1 Tax=unclassified Microbacterium TaxID=2609290 RepID=UPI00361EAB6F
MSDRVERVGFVGLGRMGLPMAANLVRAGFSVEAVDVSPDARSRAQAAGASTHDEIAALAGTVDALVLMLPDSDVVDSVVTAAESAGVLTPGLLLVDMSSSQPARTQQLASRLATRGVGLVDAPVSGGVSGAENASLTIMVGGDAPDTARARDLLQALGRTVEVGPVGAGHALKALNNLLSATHLWITGEAMAAGVRFGLDPAVMLDVFNSSSGRSGSTQKKWPDFVMTESFDSGFGLRLMLKDMRIAVQLAEQVGAFHGLGGGAVEVWARAADGLPGAADHTEIARWIAKEDESGSL